MARFLDDGSWYVLPDGTPVITCVVTDDRRVYERTELLTEQEWERSREHDVSRVEPSYVADVDGTVTRGGEPTGWTTDDLRPM
jgi:hypothetical protein